MATTTATVQNGTQTFTDVTFVGRTIQNLRSDVAWRAFFAFSGDENVMVTSTGGTPRAETNTYVIRAGDVVRFDRSAGTKG